MARTGEPAAPAPLPVEDDAELDAVRWRPSPGALRNILATALVGVGIAAIVWFFDRPGGGASSQAVTVTATAQGAAPRVGRPAPDFELTLLDGTKVRLSDYRGRPVWINFWASWCPPCRAENPDIQEVYEAHRDEHGLVLLAPAIGERRGDVEGYMERADLHYPVGLDTDTQIAANYRVLGIPTHVFVDADGIVREIRVGAMSKKTMEKMIQTLLTPREPE
ncbi:MAG TPA: TlpA disulfide reductase family protein [Dehalococcoidia bacterium]|nr:TlpA disulfide reductase family protein [Dehalococcoidia bacterium]